MTKLEQALKDFIIRLGRIEWSDFWDWFKEHSFSIGILMLIGPLVLLIAGAAGVGLFYAFKYSFWLGFLGCWIAVGLLFIVFGDM